MPGFNYPDYPNELRDIICSNPILGTVASRCDASNSDGYFSQSPTFPRVRNNSAYTMDVDSVRNTLEGMTQNAVFVQDRHMRAVMSRSDILRKLEEDYRRLEVECIKRLISSKATIRYRIEVK